MRTRSARRLLAGATLAVATTAPGLAGACAGDGSPASGAGGGDVDEITVAAASSLRPVLEEWGPAFTRDTGIGVRLVFGSSGQLQQQILNGAPFDVFASADPALAGAVADEGPGVPDTLTTYAEGRLALVGPAGTPPPGAVHDLLEPRYERVAIANPAHAPYGAAAAQALDRAGVQARLQNRLLHGESVADAHRLATGGHADAGVVAASLAVAGDDEHTLVPRDLHDPIRQTAVVTATATGAAGAAARDFLVSLASAPARDLLARYGFTPLDPAGAAVR